MPELSCILSALRMIAVSFSSLICLGRHNFFPIQRTGSVFWLEYLMMGRVTASWTWYWVHETEMDHWALAAQPNQSGELEFLRSTARLLNRKSATHHHQKAEKDMAESYEWESGWERERKRQRELRVRERESLGVRLVWMIRLSLSLIILVGLTSTLAPTETNSLTIAIPLSFSLIILIIRTIVSSHHSTLSSSFFRFK